MSDARRIGRGVSASIVGVATRIAVQFATLPIFFAFWSVEAIGVWLILFAVPSYVALVGNGFAGAGGTAVLGKVQAGDWPGARRDFKAAWAISAGSTAVLAAGLAGAAILIAPSLIAQASGIDVQDVAQAAAWLALYVFATSQIAVFEIPYRAAGRYPDHIFITNTVALLEIAVIAVAVAVSQSLAVLAMALALFRVAAASVVLFTARSAAPRLFGAGQHATGNSLGALWRPSLAFMLMPLVFGLNLQGYLLLVGASFGAVALAGFVATRTLVRVLDLVTGLAYGLQYYESGYLEGDRQAAQRRIMATMTIIALALSLAFAAALLIFGPWLQDLYTLGETRFDYAVATILLCAATLRALAAAPVAVVAAENAHTPIVAAYLAGSAAGLALAAGFGALRAPLFLVLLPLVLAEASQLVPATRRALVMLDWTPGDFFAALLSGERKSDIAAFVRLLAKR